MLAHPLVYAVRHLGGHPRFIQDLFHLRPAGSYYRVCGFESSKRDPAILGRGVLATIYMTMTPNFIVLGIDRKSSRMLFHQIERSQCTENDPGTWSPTVNFWLVAGVVVSATLVPARICVSGVRPNAGWWGWK